MYGGNAYGNVAYTGLVENTVVDSIPMLLNPSESIDNLLDESASLVLAVQETEKIKINDSIILSLNISEVATASIQWVDRQLPPSPSNWTKRI